MINCSTYFFENLKSGYHQYPDDFYSEQFKIYKEHFDTDAQLVIHRQSNLLYYTYMRKLSSGRAQECFGMSVIINGIETSNIKSLFKLFERIFQEIVSDGVILAINTEGDIIAKDVPFASYAKHFAHFSQKISEYINVGSHTFSQMLPVNYSSSTTDYGVVSLLEGDAKLKESLRQYNLIYITKDSENSSIVLNGLAVRIEHLTQQLEYFKERNNELQKKVAGNSIVNRWKSVSIALLIFIIIIVIAALYCVGSGILTFNLP